MVAIRRILAPVDFSSCSRESLTFAARLAHQCGAELHVLYVEPAFLEVVAHGQHVDLLGEARTALAEFAAEAVPAGQVAPVQHVEAGPADGTICAAADRIQADLIVMGPRGRSPLAATLLGSTTRGVLQHAPCAVAVVPAARKPAFDGS